jgi:hypothetical protein
MPMVGRDKGVCLVQTYPYMAEFIGHGISTPHAAAVFDGDD